jgi:hypothetical protein
MVKGPFIFRSNTGNPRKFSLFPGFKVVPSRIVLPENEATLETSARYAALYHTMGLAIVLVE